MYCYLEKKTIFSTDIFQPHYIYQNFLYKICGNLNELVENQKFINEETYINHVPWWKFRQLKGSEFKVDLVVMNHMICEMNFISLQKILSILNKFNNPDIFIESTGWDKYNKWSEVKNLLQKFNYNIYFSGGHFKESAKTFLVKFELNNQKQKKINFDKLSHFVPFRKDLKKLIYYVYKELLGAFKNIFFITKRELNIKNSRIFNSPSKYSFNDVKKIYSK